MTDRWRRQRLACVVGLTVVIAAVTASGPVHAAINGTEGNIDVCRAPRSVTLGAVENNERMLVFEERRDHRLPAQVTVDATGPRMVSGQASFYESDAHLTGGAIPAGTTVDSFLFHSDPVGDASGVPFRSVASFTSEIVGVVSTGRNLNASDAQTGHPRVQYPSGEFRGYELGAGREGFRISADRRSIEIMMQTFNAVDQIRVITNADPQAPSADNGTVCGGGPGADPPPERPVASRRLGYRLLTASGGVFSFGSRPLRGSVIATSPIVSGAETPSGNGYWVVAQDGDVSALGDAADFGSMAGRPLAAPVLGLAPTRSGNGYWLVAGDGGIFSFGDAAFHGSTGGIRLNQPVVGMAPTPTGNGYWLVATDGGVFSFGDARFHGSTGSIRLNRPVVGMASTPTGNGYWLVADDGGIFSFGDAAFHGSTGSIRLNQPVLGMAPTPRGDGYWLAARDGGIFAFGAAPFLGSTGAVRLLSPVVAILA